MEALRNRLGSGAGDDGFSLVELMVIVVIMGILLAVAIPTFLGVSGGASQQSTWTNLENSVTSAMLQYGNNQNFSSITNDSLGAGLLHGDNPSLTYVPGTASTSLYTVSFQETGGDQVMILADAEPSTGQCWYVMKVAAALTTAVQGETAANTYYGFNTLACQPSNAPTLTGAGNTHVWATSFAAAT